MNITYSFMNCSRPKCDDNIELRLANYSTTRSHYSKDGLMPDNEIIHNTNADFKQFFFDFNSSFTGHFLALISKETCVTVSRVLVYRYECPGHDRQSTGLLRRPATQAPVNGVEIVKPYCPENSHTSNNTLILCTYEGIWDYGGQQCKCDSGYSENEERATCEGETVLY